MLNLEEENLPITTTGLLKEISKELRIIRIGLRANKFHINGKAHLSRKSIFNSLENLISKRAVNSKGKVKYIISGKKSGIIHRKT